MWRGVGRVLELEQAIADMGREIHFPRGAGHDVRIDNLLPQRTDLLQLVVVPEFLKRLPYAGVGGAVAVSVQDELQCFQTVVLRKVCHERA